MPDILRIYMQYCSAGINLPNKGIYMQLVQIFLRSHCRLLLSVRYIQAFMRGRRFYLYTK